MSDKDLNSKEEEHLVINNVLVGKLSMGRLIILTVLSLVLCSFGPLSLFAAVPLSMAFLIFGHKKAFATSAAFMTLLIGLSLGVSSTHEWSIIATIFLMANLLAFIISRMIVKNIHPFKGLLTYGGIVLGIICLFVALLTLSIDRPIAEKLGDYVSASFEAVRGHANYKMVVNAGGQEARNLKDLIENPGVVTKEILRWSVSTVFVSVFFMLWLNVFMVLKNSLLWKELHGYEFTISDLTKIELPVYAIWPLILGLVLILVGDYVLKDTGVVIGLNILYCLGVFYFFSGFGVYLDFLDSMNIRGFFRNILIIVTIFMAFKMIALIGVLDTWIDFRRFIKKEKGEGDKI